MGKEVSDAAKAWLDWFEKAGVFPEVVRMHRDYEAGLTGATSARQAEAGYGYGGPPDAVPPVKGKPGQIDGQPERAYPPSLGPGPAADGARAQDRVQPSRPDAGGMVFGGIRDPAPDPSDTGDYAVRHGLNTSGFRARYLRASQWAAGLLREGAYDAQDPDADWLRNNIRIDVRTGRSSVMDAWLAELDETADKAKGKQIVRQLTSSMDALERHARVLQDLSHAKHEKSHPRPPRGELPQPAKGEPIAKVVSVDPAHKGGKAELFVKRQASGGVEAGKVGTLLCLGDKVQTGPDTVCAIEFLIGGRAALTRNTSVEILDERSVGGAPASAKRILVKTVNLWIKADAKQLKQPLEIQTNGGVMGIKG